MWTHQVQALRIQLATVLPTGVCGVPEEPWAGRGQTPLSSPWGTIHSTALWGRKGECWEGTAAGMTLVAEAGGLKSPPPAALQFLTLAGPGHSRDWPVGLGSPCCMLGLGAGQRRSRGQPVLNQPSKGILWGRSHAGMGELNPNV